MHNFSVQSNRYDESYIKLVVIAQNHKSTIGSPCQSHSRSLPYKIIVVLNVFFLSVGIVILLCGRVFFVVSSVIVIIIYDRTFRI
jgi:hypothetical protein